MTRRHPLRISVRARRQPFIYAFIYYKAGSSSEVIYSGTRFIQESKTVSTYRNSATGRLGYYWGFPGECLVCIDRDYLPCFGDIWHGHDIGLSHCTSTLRIGFLYEARWGWLRSPGYMWPDGWKTLKWMLKENPIQDAWNDCFASVYTPKLLIPPRGYKVWGYFVGGQDWSWMPSLPPLTFLESNRWLAQCVQINHN